MVQRLGLHAFTAEDLGSIPGRGTKILQAPRHGQRKQKQNKQKTTTAANNQTLKYISVRIKHQNPLSNPNLSLFQ